MQFITIDEREKNIVRLKESIHLCRYNIYTIYYTHTNKGENIDDKCVVELDCFVNLIVKIFTFIFTVNVNFDDNFTIGKFTLPLINIIY